MSKQIRRYSYTAGNASSEMGGKVAGDGKMETDEASHETLVKILADLRNLECVILKIRK